MIYTMTLCQFSFKEERTMSSGLPELTAARKEKIL